MVTIAHWSGELKSTCPTQFFSFPKKYLNKNFQNQRAITSNLCKMFPLLSHKHYLISSLLIDIMIMTSSIKKKHISLRHKVIGIKRCHHGMCVYSSISKFGSRISANLSSNRIIWIASRMLCSFGHLLFLSGFP